MAAINELAEALTAGGSKVGVFRVPANVFIRAQVTIPKPPVQENARGVLLRVLAATDRPLSWRLSYLTDYYQGYALTVHALE